MAMHFGARYTSVSQITGPSGFYNIKLGNDNVVVFVDQEYDGGGWVCVMANRQNTGGMNNLTYYNAINTCNYRSTSSTTPAPLYEVASAGLGNYNIWIGTKYWEALGKRHDTNNVTVVQFVAPTNGTALSGVHTKRYRWRFSNFTPTFAFSGVAAVSDETSTGSPGFYNNHAAGGYNLSTYDNDQDTNGGSCSSYYNNNPWWYESCWSGNYFAGSGYADAPYWVGSGGDYHQYGAVYIK